MPKPRKSIKQLELHGTLSNHAGRYKDRQHCPPTTGEIGNAPAYFDTELQSVWKEIIRTIPAGIAGSADRFAVEVAARLLYQFRTEPFMPASKVAILNSTLSRLGCDPQARTKLQIGERREPTGSDAYTKYMNATRNGTDPTIH